MPALTAAEITAEIEEAWKEGEPHGVSCTCCARADSDYPDLRIMLFREASYAVSRFAPDEALTDETQDSLDDLAQRMALAAIPVAQARMTQVAAAYLAGKVVAR